MRILMISDFYPPVMGGMERHVQGLSEALGARGHEVIVETLGWADLKRRESKKNLQIYRDAGLYQRLPIIYSDKNKRFHPPAPDPVIVHRIKKRIEQYRPDIIHAHGWILYSVLHACNHDRVPLVTTLHDYGYFCLKRSLLDKNGESPCSGPSADKCLPCYASDSGCLKAAIAYSSIQRYKKLLDRVDRFIAVSSYIETEYKKHFHVSANRMITIPNFCFDGQLDGDTGNQKPDIDVDLPDRFILFVGTLAPHKGVDVLLDAYKRIDTDAGLVLIGIKHGAYRYRPDGNVMVLENQPHEVVMQAWRRCLFGVLPSVSPEPCATTALEAMMTGRAVIASDTGGFQDIVKQEETGLLVPPGDPDALAGAIKLLLTEPVLARAMGARGGERYTEHFSLDKVVVEIEALYRSLSIKPAVSISGKSAIIGQT
jgi:glycosyltransferase involved in cell wall biosynthesis